MPTTEQLRLDRRIGVSKTDWKKRGPYNVGGRTRALAVDISDENVLLAGGVSGGMWRSTDGGQNWSKTTKPEQLHSVTTIAQDLRTGKNSIWYYGTGEYTGNSAIGGGNNAYFSGDGIFKSTDGGENWKEISGGSSGFPDTEGTGRIGLDISKSNPNIIYAILDNQDRKASTPSEQKNDDLTKDMLRDISISDFLKLSDKKS